MIIKDSNFHKLYETQKFILGHAYEYAYLIRKNDYKEIHIGGFYGDPACGLIDADNKWCLVGGNMLTIWTEDKGLVEIEDEELSWICKVRQTTAYDVEILIDPWSEQGAIWTLNVKTVHKQKMRDYKLSGEYFDQIEW